VVLIEQGLAIFRQGGELRVLVGGEPPLYLGRPVTEVVISAVQEKDCRSASAGTGSFSRKVHDNRSVRG